MAKSTLLAGTKGTAAVLSAAFFAAWLAVSHAWSVDTYDWQEGRASCLCRTIYLGDLTSADWSQDPATQQVMWEDFRDDYSLSDSDRVAPATKTYNCHSYVFNASDRWLNTGPGGTYEFSGTDPGCWSVPPSGGTAGTSEVHSFLVFNNDYLNNQGKCGTMFVCKHNQNVYTTETLGQSYRISKN